MRKDYLYMLRVFRTIYALSVYAHTAWMAHVIASVSPASDKWGERISRDVYTQFLVFFFLLNSKFRIGRAKNISAQGGAERCVFYL